MMQGPNAATELDEELYERYLRQNDRALLEDLVARWERPAYLVARCICGNAALAEEVVQEAFLKLLTRRAAFQNQGPGSFRAWFLSLTTNCARMARRSERRAEARKRVCPKEYANRKGIGFAPHPLALCSDDAAGLKNALNNLEECWRTPVALHFMHGLRQKEVALRLGISQQLVSMRIERGLAKLRICLVRPPATKRDRTPPSYRSALDMKLA